jgi:hypothetical protein
VVRAGQRKDGLSPQEADCDDRGLVSEQVLYVGMAQEKQKVFRPRKRRNPVTGTPQTRNQAGRPRPRGEACKLGIVIMYGWKS